jgi:hypothetical protein
MQLHYQVGKKLITILRSTFLSLCPDKEGNRVFEWRYVVVERIVFTSYAFGANIAKFVQESVRSAFAHLALGTRSQRSVSCFQEEEKRGGNDKKMITIADRHFPLYIFCVIIYVIIWCYHLLLSFPPFFLFPEKVTHSSQSRVQLTSYMLWRIYEKNNLILNIVRLFTKRQFT